MANIRDEYTVVTLGDIDYCILQECEVRALSLERHHFIPADRVIVPGCLRAPLPSPVLPVRPATVINLGERELTREFIESTLAAFESEDDVFQAAFYKDGVLVVNILQHG